MIKTNNKSSPHKRIKISCSYFHTRGPANCLLPEPEINSIHGLVKPDSFLIILEKIDLVAACAKIT